VISVSSVIDIITVLYHNLSPESIPQLFMVMSASLVGYDDWESVFNQRFGERPGDGTYREFIHASGDLVRQNLHSVRPASVEELDDPVSLYFKLERHAVAAVLNAAEVDAAELHSPFCDVPPYAVDTSGVRNRIADTLRLYQRAWGRDDLSAREVDELIPDKLMGTRRAYHPDEPCPCQKQEMADVEEIETNESIDESTDFAAEYEKGLLGGQLGMSPDELVTTAREWLIEISEDADFEVEEVGCTDPDTTFSDGSGSPLQIRIRNANGESVLVDLYDPIFSQDDEKISNDLSNRSDSSRVDFALRSASWQKFEDALDGMDVRLQHDEAIPRLKAVWDAMTPNERETIVFDRNPYRCFPFRDEDVDLTLSWDKVNYGGGQLYKFIIKRICGPFFYLAPVGEVSDEYAAEDAIMQIYNEVAAASIIRDMREEKLLPTWEECSSSESIARFISDTELPSILQSCRPDDLTHYLRHSIVSAEWNSGRLFGPEDAVSDEMLHRLRRQILFDITPPPKGFRTSRHPTDHPSLTTLRDHSDQPIEIDNNAIADLSLAYINSHWQKRGRPVTLDPATERQWHSVCGPEVLLPHESMYEPETVAAIREKLAGKRVVMVDQDGVTLPHDRDRTQAWQLGDDVSQTLQALHEQGYTLVYWTNTPNADGNVAETLMSSEVASLFSLVVCGDNYVLRSNAQVDNALQMINSATWLDDETRRQLMECVRRGGKVDFLHERMIPKLPMCLAEECATVDDDPWWHQDLLSEEIKDSGAFPLFVPSTLNTNDTPNEQHFGTHWIKRILEEFPPIK